MCLEDWFLIYSFGLSNPQLQQATGVGCKLTRKSAQNIIIMAISIPDVKFELSQVYKTYVDQLQLSSNVSNFLINSADISSAGNQVEQSLRILLKNLLPERVAVTHGHIVDKTSKISYQQDILLAESFFTKSLIKSIDGTEFYPFESIFRDRKSVV